MTRPSGPLYVAGHRGLVGSAIWREGLQRGLELVGEPHDALDLAHKDQVDAFLDRTRPSSIILAAARVGGIVANSTYPAEFLHDNLMVQLNVIQSAVERDVPKLLFLGSSCIYPKFAPQPISESSLLTGPLEPTNDAYAIAKIAGVIHIQAVRRQYGLHYISAMPTNLYGPGDNFDLQTSHVLPAMIRKMHEAKVLEKRYVDMWGTGSPRREFLHVDDMAKACLFLLENYDAPEPINVGTGEDLTIRDLAVMVKEIVGFEGQLVWDASKPDGTPRKQLNTQRINDLGWKPTVSLNEGIRSTYEWYLAHANRDARL
jgi:GDP-L-fucose synthase